MTYTDLNYDDLVALLRKLGDNFFNQKKISEEILPKVFQYVDVTTAILKHKQPLTGDLRTMVRLENMYLFPSELKKKYTDSSLSEAKHSPNVVLGLLSIHGFRWKKYETLDGMVYAFERLGSETPFPVLIHRMARVQREFEDLTGMVLTDVLLNCKYKQISITDKGIYISL